EAGACQSARISSPQKLMAIAAAPATRRTKYVLRRRTATRNSHDTSGSRFTVAGQLEHRPSPSLSPFHQTIQPFCAANRTADHLVWCDKDFFDTRAASDPPDRRLEPRLSPTHNDTATRA